KTKSFYDMLGDVTTLIQAYTGSADAVKYDPATMTPGSANNVTTIMSYRGPGQIGTSTEKRVTGGQGTQDWVTQYNYGVTIATTATGASIDNNDLLLSIQYPNPTGAGGAMVGSASNQSEDQETFGYDALGEMTSK